MDGASKEHLQNQLIERKSKRRKEDELLAYARTPRARYLLKKAWRSQKRRPRQRIIYNAHVR